MGPVPHLNLSVPHLINVSVPQFYSLCPTCDAFVPHQYRLASAATGINQYHLYWKALKLTEILFALSDIFTNESPLYCPSHSIPHFHLQVTKYSLYELLSYRDKYKEQSQLYGGMHKELVERFIETQTIVFSPICPHICERVWQLTGNTVLCKRIQFLLE